MTQKPIGRYSLFVIRYSLKNYSALFVIFMKKGIKRFSILLTTLLLCITMTGALSSCSCESVHTVRFVVGDGQADIIRIIEGGKIEMPDDPTRKNFVFMGWFYSSNGGDTLSEPFENENLSGNTIVYANWFGGEFDVSLQPGVYDTEQTVSFATATGRPIFYTLDGSDPELLPLSGGVYKETATTKIFDPKNPIVVKNRATDRPRLAEMMLAGGKMWNDQLEVGSYNGIPPHYNRGTVIKAALIGKNGALGRVWTGTYIVWPNHPTEFDLPVMSIALPAEQLFGKKADSPPDGGIYRFYDSSLSGYIATFEYFDKNKKLVFFRDGELRVSNGKYAGGAPQKTFNVNLNRGIYNNPVEYPVWGNVKRGARSEPVTSFSRFRLRQDGQSYSYGGYNHVLAQKLAECLHPATSASIPTAVYLNGDFWGIYALEEQYNDRYLADHYNDDRRNMIQLNFKSKCKNDPEVENAPDEQAAKTMYQNMYDFAKSGDFTNPAVYKEFGEKYIDLNDYTDAVLAHVFFNNPDYPGNNNRMWRAAAVREGAPYIDGRWRPMLYDFDLAFLEDVENWFKPDQDMLAHFLGIDIVAEKEDVGKNTEKLNPGWSTLFFRRLMSNREYRTFFLDRAAYFYNYVLEPTRVAKYVDECYNQLKTMQKFQDSRWMLGDVSLEKVRDDYKTAIAARREIVMQHFSAHYSQNTNTAFNTLDGDPEFDAEKSKPLWNEAFSIVPIALELTTEATLNANKTAFGWQYPLSGRPAPEFSSGNWITEWTDLALTKQFKVFSNMQLKLTNDDPDFLRYDVSTDGGATFAPQTDRNATVTAGTGKMVIRTVYKA